MPGWRGSTVLSPVSLSRVPSREETTVLPGWRAEVKLATDPDRPHIGVDAEPSAGHCWRSGEAVSGIIELSRLDVDALPVSSIVARCYWQSESAVRLKSLPAFDASNGKMPRFVPATMRNIAEYHRAYALAGGEGVVLWDALHSTQSETEAIQFSFVLPTTTKTAFANPVAMPPSDRARLMNCLRAPPPTYRTKTGSVQWCVEVIVELAAPLSPESGTIIHDPRTYDEEEHECMGRLYSTPTRLVERVTFPFEPLDAHSPAPWLGDDAPPSLSGDPRKDLKRVVEAKKVKSLLVAQLGGPARWSNYEKAVKVKRSTFGRPVANLITQVSVPKPAILSRQRTVFPLLLHFSLANPKSRLLPSRSSVPDSISIDHVTVVLFERLSTRTGASERPSVIVREMRRQEFKLYARRDDVPALTRTRTSNGTMHVSDGAEQDTHSSLARSILSARSGLQLLASKPGVDLQLKFDLQSESLHPTDSVLAGTAAQRPFKERGLSFATPNIERDYILSVTVHPSAGSGEPFMACRVPVHVVAGDDDAVPTFDDVLREDSEAVLVRAGGEGLPSYTE